MRYSQLLTLLFLSLILCLFSLNGHAEPQPLNEFMDFFNQNHSKMKIQKNELACLALAKAELAARSNKLHGKEEPIDWIFSETTDKGLVFLHLLSKKTSYEKIAKQRGYKNLEELVTQKSVSLLRKNDTFKSCTQSKAAQLQACAPRVESGAQSVSGCLSRK